MQVAESFATLLAVQPPSGKVPRSEPGESCEDPTTDRSYPSIHSPTSMPAEPLAARGSAHLEKSDTNVPVIAQTPTNAHVNAIENYGEEHPVPTPYHNPTEPALPRKRVASRTSRKPPKKAKVDSLESLPEWVIQSEACLPHANPCKSCRGISINPPPDVVKEGCRFVNFRSFKLGMPSDSGSVMFGVSPTDSKCYEYHPWARPCTIDEKEEVKVRQT